ncbi:MAG: ABC transporter permease [Limnobacter sp.]|nr:ABC transporter permease [Limnobacter sp.]
MPFDKLFRVALRNLLRQVRHSVFALAGISIGVMGLALADGFIQDVFRQLGEATVKGQLGHIQLARPGFRDGGAGRPEAFVIEDDAAIRKALARQAGVRTVAGRLQLSGVLNASNRELPVEVVGSEPELEADAGDYLSLLDGVRLERAAEFSALLGEGVARQLGVRAGDFVTLTAATFDGSLNALELGVAGVFRTFTKDYDDRAVRVRLVEAQELVQVAGVNTLVVGLEDTDRTAAVLESIRQLPELSDLDARPWYELSDFYANTRELYARQFGVLQLIALCLIAMSVLTSTNITVFERTAEFGTMRALGARSRTVVALIVLESAVLGTLGAILGSLLAVAVGSGLSWIGIPMPPPPNAEAGFTARILLTPGAIVSASLVGVVSAVLGALLPSIRVARIPIVTQLGQRI